MHNWLTDSCDKVIVKPLWPGDPILATYIASVYLSDPNVREALGRDDVKWHEIPELMYRVGDDGYIYTATAKKNAKSVTVTVSKIADTGRIQA